MHPEAHETPERRIPGRGIPNRGVPDVRAVVGRRADDAGDRLQGLLEEIHRLRRGAARERNREALKRLLLVLGLLTAHGPRGDRLLRYQLDEMDEHLRRLAGIGLAV